MVKGKEEYQALTGHLWSNPRAFGMVNVVRSQLSSGEISCIVQIGLYQLYQLGYNLKTNPLFVVSDFMYVNNKIKNFCEVRCAL